MLKMSNAILMGVGSINLFSEKFNHCLWVLFNITKELLRALQRELLVYSIELPLANNLESLFIMPST